MSSQKVLFELWSWARYYFPLSSYVAPFHGAPLSAARQLLKLGKVSQEDVIFDLGCGDGRLLTMAAQQPFGARGVGYELDRGLACEARTQIRKLGLDHRLEVREVDARAASIEQASVIFMYLSVDGNRSLHKAFRDRVKPGTRLLTLAFPVPGLQDKLSSQGQARGLGLFVYIL